jgi:eukaryotic-like serine/threonine-protein kinase
MADDTELDAVLAEALALPLEARPAWLETRCGRDTPIRAAVDRILREAEASAAFLEPGGALHGALGDSLRNELAAEEGLAVGDAVGPYRLVEEIGRGGMAVVYRAARADGAFAQEVALKVVKRGIDTDDVLGRFRQERQILASLTHAHIARLLDGGVTADGRPYLAMELVHGEPLDRYCAARRLGLDARLDLCIAIAEAVQHAHQRLVVHRDLKPSNILITDAGEIRLLDFGIAKLLDPAADGEATATRTALRLLTPDYASPEQVRGDTITTASDVYQLGLILFELVTGRRAQAIAGLGPAEAERAICTHELPRASQALGDGTPYPGAAKRRLRGDLDRIVATAVAKAPERRYRSLSALADDLQRFRRGLPVSARGDSLWYRTTTFVRRNRVAVAAAAAVVLAVGGIVGFYSWRLAAERDRARQEAATANEAVTFLTGLFTAADPVRPTGTPVTARELLDRGAARVRTDLAGQPELQARMLSVIGTIYNSLALRNEAIPLLEQSLALRRRQFGPRHLEVAKGAQLLAMALHTAGRSTDAQPLYEEALAIHESLPGPASDDMTPALSGLGLVYRRAGRLDEAKTFLERAVQNRERALGPEAAPLAATLNNLGLLYTTRRDLPQARAALERALAIHRKHRGPEHPLVAGTLSNLADVFRLQSDLEGARVRHEEAVAITVKAYGDAHPATATGFNAYGQLLLDMQRYAEAGIQFERAIAVYERSVGISHPTAPFPVENLGHVYKARGDRDAALRQYERGLALREAAHGPVHPDVAQSHLNIGLLMLEMRGCAAALPRLRRGIEVSDAAKASTPARVGEAQAAIARCEAADVAPPRRAGR